ncbi:hypothetical protein O181_090045 [Austropuccinia psidii MF-1]|uniref:CCHC-type domain-containing protein n=1 Tax=Austropuccinia psidii MF-1 TaxID=1389203 RepID=A0A9Q3IV16_9BASI|nr:hypothetical protein [Austropuccinia psidii MF-1]
MKILKRCGGELENALGSRSIEPCSTEEYINALEEIVTRTKIGIKWKKLEIKSPKKPFINEETQKEPLQSNKPNEKRECHKCGGIGHLANNCLEKEKINEIVEKEGKMRKKNILILKKILKNQRPLKVIKST